MGGYHDLPDRIETPARALSEDEIDALVSLCGYVIPLFTDPAYAARTPFGRRPVPGPALLSVMGGLVEQTGRFDDATALLGFDDVRFVAPAFAGDPLHVEVEVVRREPTRSGSRGIVTMRWRCAGADGSTLAEATARMLFAL